MGTTTGQRLTFQIKICGITTVEDAQAAERVGADAIGLNFYPRSSRAVTPQQASLIAAGLAADIRRVGVFVNTTESTIRECTAAVGLDAIQLHGDEPPEFVTTLRPLPVIRAFRLQTGDLPRACAYIQACGGADGLTAVLMDAAVPGQYGGTGQLTRWSLVAEIKQKHPDIPVILAGGLTPSNVAQAIRSVHPDAVDTASGVESAPGCKDYAALTRFVHEARRAFAESGP